MSEDVRAAQRKLDRAVTGRAGVSGTAVGRRGGEPCLMVYVENTAAGRSLPKRIGRFPVVVEVTGRFRRL